MHLQLIKPGKLSNGVQVPPFMQGFVRHASSALRDIKTLVHTYDVSHNNIIDTDDTLLQGYCQKSKLYIYIHMVVVLSRLITYLLSMVLTA